MGYEFHLYGPPGTGKTTTLVNERIARAADGYGGRIPLEESAIATSFSNTAVNHLRSKVFQFFEEPYQSVATLNALGFRQLQPLDDTKLAVFENNTTSKGKKPWLEWNKLYPRWQYQPKEADSEDDDFGPRKRGELPMGTVMQEAYSGARQRLYGSAESMAWLKRQLGVGISREGWEAYVTAYERFKYDSGCIDFADQLAIPLREQMPVPFSPEVVYIDEAQDLSPLMLALVRMWRDVHGVTLIMAGDDDQSINGSLNGAEPTLWTGADGITGTVVLDQSYRVSYEVHEVAANIAKQIKNRVPKEWNAAEHHGEAVEILGDWFSAPHRIANKVAELEASGQSVMLIASCGYMLDNTLALLKAKGILYHNPYREGNYRWNPLSSTYAKLCRIMARKVITWRTAVDLESILSNPPKTGLFRNATYIRTQGKDYANSELAEEPVPMTELNPAALDAFYEDELAFIAQNCKKTLRVDYPIAVFRQYGGEMVEPLVTVGTIFSVKGGEADNVVIMPDMSGAGWEEYMRNPPSAHRLYYVGVTRAKYNLYVTRQNPEYGKAYPLIRALPRRTDRYAEDNSAPFLLEGSRRD